MRSTSPGRLAAAAAAVAVAGLVVIGVLHALAHLLFALAAVVGAAGASIALVTVAIGHAAGRVADARTRIARSADHPLRPGLTGQQAAEADARNLDSARNLDELRAILRQDREERWALLTPAERAAELLQTARQRDLPQHIRAALRAAAGAERYGLPADGGK